MFEIKNNRKAVTINKLKNDLEELILEVIFL